MKKAVLPFIALAASLLTTCTTTETAPGIEPTPRTGFFARRLQERLPAEKADVAVIFIGGFGEWVLTHIREIYEIMPVLPAEGRQLRAFYTWHGGRGPLNGYSTKLIREDLEAFLAVNPNASVVIIGHSYGGSAALDVVRRLEVKPGAHCIVATIDPVSRRAPSHPRERAENIDYWINIYCEPYRHPKDSIAAIGGPWRECPEADVNICFSGKDRDKDGARYQHAGAMSLFFETAPGQTYSGHELLEQACRRIIPQAPPEVQQDCPK